MMIAFLSKLGWMPKYFNDCLNIHGGCCSSSMRFFDEMNRSKKHTSSGFPTNSDLNAIG